MRFALPILNGRIAPLPTSARELVVVDSGSAARDLERIGLEDPTLVDLAALLKRREVDFLVCCGIDRNSKQDLYQREIGIIENVACAETEAVEAIFEQRLLSGFGLYREKAATRPGTVAESTAGTGRGKKADWFPSCLVFDGKSCAGGRACPLAELARSEEDSGSRRMLDAAVDIALEKERSLCRLSEVIYFCLEMKYRTIGLAFCSDLEEPARIAASVLRRFFRVIGVCCKAGSKTEPVAKQCGKDPRAETGVTESCNPLGQAQVLNRASCDLVILIGLCVGADCVLTKACKAPVTTLFVKDKVLANNPIGALYSKHYLKESLRALSST